VDRSRSLPDVEGVPDGAFEERTRGLDRRVDGSTLGEFGGDGTRQRTTRAVRGLGIDAGVCERPDRLVGYEDVHDFLAGDVTSRHQGRVGTPTDQLLAGSDCTLDVDRFDPGEDARLFGVWRDDRRGSDEVLVGRFRAAVQQSVPGLGYHHGVDDCRCVRVGEFLGDAFDDRFDGEHTGLERLDLEVRPDRL
jgi:hypothetical protein